MPERKERLLAISLSLFFLAFIAGLALALLSKDAALVLENFSLPWLLLSAGLMLGTWAPAILLASAAINTEGSASSSGFSTAAMKSLAPALILAGVISLYYLLAVPLIQEKKNWYEQSSALYASSLKKAEKAVAAKQFDEAETQLHIAGSIDNKNKTYIDLAEKTQSGLAQNAITKIEASPAKTDIPQQKDQLWKEGNRFYLEALQARKEKRVFDAHYLAKRSAAVFPDRIEVQRLISETWEELQKSGPSQSEMDEAILYRSKVEGYGYFEAGDFVHAYQIFNDLFAANPGDQDIINYKSRSEEALKNVAFFIEEDIRAFSGSNPPPFNLRTVIDGKTLAMKASQAAISRDGVFFRNLEIEWGGSNPQLISAPFARLHNTTLSLRAVDRKDPKKVWSPTWSNKDGKTPDGLILNFPYSADDASLLLSISQKPHDVPLMLLATSTEKAVALGIDPIPLRVEFASRIAYPFITIMVVLFGAALGMRFRARESPGVISRILGGPVLAALALIPLAILSRVGFMLATLLAMNTSGITFIAGWVGILAGGVTMTLLFSARASLHAPR